MARKILPALLEIQRDIHASGIGKNRRNKEQNFDFRGIDDALRAFAPLFSNHGVLCAPKFHDIVVSQRSTKSGGATYNIQVQGTFTFTCVEDESEYVVGPVYGEANDGQDKGTSKAESVAFRQMLFIAFAVPHEPVIGGDPDEDAGEEAEPDYLDWKEAIAGEFTVDGLKGIKRELASKFGLNTVPQVLINLCVARMEAIKAGATPA